MKKLIGLFLLVVSCIALSGCAAGKTISIDEFKAAAKSVGWTENITRQAGLSSFRKNKCNATFYVFDELGQAKDKYEEILANGKLIQANDGVAKIDGANAPLFSYYSVKGKKKYLHVTIRLKTVMVASGDNSCANPGEQLFEAAGY